MSGRCKVTGCTDTPPRGGYGWCPTHLAQWKAGTLLPTSVARPVQVAYLPPVEAPTPKPTPAAAVAGRRCGSCAHVFPVLVDDVLCVRCDSLHYPAAVAS